MITSRAKPIASPMKLIAENPILHRRNPRRMLNKIISIFEKYAYTIRNEMFD